MKNLFHGLLTLFTRILKKPYPKEYLKGVPNDTFITDDRRVKTHLFQFKDPEVIRNDGLIEDSINWFDDSGALKLTLEQKKKDTEEYQFRAGVALFPKDKLDALMTNNQAKDRLSYERKKIIDNDYHGNLLIRADTDKPHRKQIAASIALTLSELIDNHLVE